MKLLTFVPGAGAFETAPGEARRIGALMADGGRALDLTTAAAARMGAEAGFAASMLALIDAGADGLGRAAELLAEAERGGAAADAVVALDAISFRSPLPRPRQMRDCLVFETHLIQAMEGGRRLLAGLKGTTPEALGLPPVTVPQVWYEQPIYYKANRFSVIGHEQPVRWPSHSKLMDYELELGIVLAKGGRDIPAETAHDHIFGYTIFNDMTARDTQFTEMQGSLGPAKGKDFDTGNIIGPWIVTADEMTDPYALGMRVRVNGELRGEGSSASMQHRFDRILAHISRDETLHAGEFIGSGTVGNGCGIETGQLLDPDDVVELEIDGIGRLRNRITLPRV
ncbi:fumarylacetoacetate hydrolase family protein [Tistrella mobilis]|uniref:fumarylacetoacetate hydrolase family protein n=1 Tax=Tistrella mobilis TaxID=171437 RepID=UPI000C0B103E|nr:isomerase [Tistrella sp.]